MKSLEQIIAARMEVTNEMARHPFGSLGYAMSAGFSVALQWVCSDDPRSLEQWVQTPVQELPTDAKLTNFMDGGRR